jgi:hypothetical protein
VNFYGIQAINPFPGLSFTGEMNLYYFSLSLFPRSPCRIHGMPTHMCAQFTRAFFMPDGFDDHK